MNNQAMLPQGLNLQGGTKNYRENWVGEVVVRENERSPAQIRKERLNRHLRRQNCASPFKTVPWGAEFQWLAVEMRLRRKMELLRHRIPACSWRTAPEAQNGEAGAQNEGSGAHFGSLHCRNAPEAQNEGAGAQKSSMSSRNCTSTLPNWAFAFKQSYHGANSSNLCLKCFKVAPCFIL